MSLVELARFTLYQDAEIARSKLESEGLHAVVFDHFTNQYIGWGRTLGVRLMVLDVEYDEARGILESVGGT